MLCGPVPAHHARHARPRLPRGDGRARARKGGDQTDTPDLVDLTPAEIRRLLAAEPRRRPARRDHAVWFHRPFRADEWFPYDQESPIAIGGRGLARGRIYDPLGRLLVSVVREGLFRSL
ncbi:hypothetical protein [Streptomyces sp. NPDC001250]|uniref:hypothetical protein n=1 Tax=unclassified Streptomyces TaxID=2593676 RepID=UPI00332491C3